MNLNLASQPAFPAEERHAIDGHESVKFYTGMTLRQYYAGVALQGLLANQGTTGTGTDIAPMVTGVAVFIADSLIAELAR